MNVTRKALVFAALTLPCSVFAETNVMEACIDCHGADGVGRENTIPNLRGQPKAYLEAQVLAFKSGQRHSTFMDPVVHNVADEELIKAADFYASIAVSTPETLQWRGDKWPADMPLGERIAYSGKWNDKSLLVYRVMVPTALALRPVFRC